MPKTTYYLIVFLLATVFAIWEGFVLSCLWGWFIVPVFKLPELALIPASGITLVVGMMTRTDNIASIFEPDMLIVLKRAAEDSIMTTSFVLIIGRLLSFFM